MFSKKERMSREEFSRIFAKGKRVHSPLFTVVLLPSKTSVGARAVVVSKKVAKTAVARNALRRRLYNVLREVAASDIDYIVIAKKPAGAHTRDYDVLYNTLKLQIGRSSDSR